MGSLMVPVILIRKPHRSLSHPAALFTETANYPHVHVWLLVVVSASRFPPYECVRQPK